MNYYYGNRGKCERCGQIVWNTSKSTGIICKCGLCLLTDTEEINITSITDEEFIDAIKKEYGYSPVEEITIIKL